MILDMHCHLDLYAEPFDVARKCQELGVFVLSVTTTPKAWKGTKKLEIENSKIRTAIGLHPQVASQRIAELDLFDEKGNKVSLFDENNDLISDELFKKLSLFDKNGVPFNYKIMRNLKMKLKK